MIIIATISNCLVAIITERERKERESRPVDGVIEVPHWVGLSAR